MGQDSQLFWILGQAPAWPFFVASVFRRQGFVAYGLIIMRQNVR